MTAMEKESRVAIVGTPTEVMDSLDAYFAKGYKIVPGTGFGIPKGKVGGNSKCGCTVYLPLDCLNRDRRAVRGR